jgi:hypothetical protein
MPYGLYLRSEVSATFAGKACSVVSATGLHGHESRFSRPEQLHFSFKQLLSYLHGAKWTSFRTNYFSENLVAQAIEPGTSGSVATNSDRWTTRKVQHKSLLPLISQSGNTPLLAPNWGLVPLV